MNRQETWQREQQYFDAEEYSETAVPADTVRRYMACNKPWLAPEAMYASFGDLAGKRVLELGCGDGGNSILLALKGARVTGVDISPRAIEAAERRAAVHGLQDRIAFVRDPVESFAARNPEPFDVVCGWAILHHLIPVLDELLGSLEAVARPGALFVFSEPLALWGWLRRFRLLLPIRVQGTPDERPLEKGELELLARHLGPLQVRYFGALLRVLSRFRPGRYEDLGVPARFAFDCLGRTDNLLLNGLALHGLASIAVIRGRLPGR